MANFSSLLLIFTLQAHEPAMRANFLPEMKQPFFGCAEKADLEHLIRLMARSPRGAGQNEDALILFRTRCIRIPKAIVNIERREGDFACVRARKSQRTCLWVPGELIGDSVLDDGVF
jgi:hypothetical protein